MFSHPVYQYLQARYQLNGKSVHWEPEEMPSAESWQELEALLKEHPAKWMVWEGEPTTEIVERLRQFGVDSVMYDPCGNRPHQGDFIVNMGKNVKALSEALSR